MLALQGEVEQQEELIRQLFTLEVMELPIFLMQQKFGMVLLGLLEEI
jgi:hypothetical protein